MSLQERANEDVVKMSMVEIANLVLLEQKKNMAFLDLFEEVVLLKNFTDQQKDRNLSQFYTDLNLDGRFIALGSNIWGLKQWFPLSQTSEKMLAEARKRLDELEKQFIEANEEDLDLYDKLAQGD